MARRYVLTVALGATAFMSACSDSTGPNGALTAEEIRDLSAQMGSFFLGGAAAPMASFGPTDGSFRVVPLELDVNLTVPCPRGGTTRLSGSLEATFDDVTETFIASVQSRNQPDDCAFLAHGKEITITGDIQAAASVKSVKGRPAGTHTATLEGSFSWEKEGGDSGTCTVSYTARAFYDVEEPYAEVDGNFCGNTVSFRGPLTH